MVSKSPKGSVAVAVVDGRLRLRWQAYDVQNRQKRFTLTYGAANATNQIAAEILAREIELDIASRNFDPSLRKYKARTERPESITIESLMNRYISAQIPINKTSSRDRYTALKNHLLNCHRSLNVDDCTEKKAIAFISYLQECELNGRTINMYLTAIRAVWKWAIKRGITQINPWLDLKVENEPKKPANPFSRNEMSQIVAAFDGSYYQNFVRFLFGAGCRTGEAIALHWDAVSDDCSEVWFRQSWNLRLKQVTPTKTNEIRLVPLSPGIQSMLQELKRINQGSRLVFPAPKGGYIDRGNFLRRHWKPTLEQLGIEYRSTYNTRHTRWSHEIANKLDVAIAARYAGNSVRVMLDTYVGAIDRPRLSDFDE